ncbi:MAG TPA: urease accessory protein UreD, partial [Verrucomicrobiota bacterium]|nr:urease accessory protein UreD [Verrucomicrobiota bacterium]
MTGASDITFARTAGAGSALLRTGRVAGRSAALSVRATSPLKLLTPRTGGDSVWAYLSSFGGGLVAGDETSLAVEVAEGSTCFLGTQASTKIFRNPEHRPCSHHVHGEVGDGGLLVLAPDVVQAFAGSTYVQRQRFHLGDRGGLVLLDWLSAGRSECGERWAFQRYHSRNEVLVGGRLRVLDSLLLDSADGPFSSAGRAGRSQCLAFLLLLGPRVEKAAQRLLAEIGSHPVSRRA